MQDNLTLSDKPSTGNGVRPQTSRTNAGGNLPPPYSSVVGNRSENIRPRPPPDRRPSGSQDRRPSGSQDRRPSDSRDAKRGHRATNSGGPGASSSRGRPTDELDIFADPVEESPKKSGARRNSESSVIERSGKILSPEEEKERHERRRRERRQREKSKDGRPKRPNRKLDLIDKLDVTGIYGTGCEYLQCRQWFKLLTGIVFHHDGPFDACNPHRNRNGSRRAPMQAFPKDSLNNVLGGGGPVNRRPDHATFLGNNDEEAFKDYSAGSNGPRMKQRLEANIQSATTTLEPIHGEESLGLGTSTFLEGAPASRTAMQRRESESGPTGGGLNRKKSLAQKIRGINTTRREYGGPGRVNGPDGVYSASAISPPARTPGGSKLPERNPFFGDNPDGDETKKDAFVARPRKGSASPGSPIRSGERLERRTTAEGSPDSDQKPSVGFLSRVKSLKGGPRKPREMKPPPQLPAE